jgi:urease subunit alpha
LNFLSPQAIKGNLSDKLGLKRIAIGVKDTRSLKKKDLPLNNALPKIEVNPETYEVRADGKILTCQPLERLPLAQRYFMF